MRILSVNKTIEIKNHEVITVFEHELKGLENIESFDYIIVNGGDGTLRRTMEKLYKKNLEKKPIFIINPAGTFNVFYKTLGCKNFLDIKKQIEDNKPLCTKKQPYYSINDKKIFLFSAGNSLDVLYIACSELIRVGLLRKSKFRYLLSFLFMLPLILVTFLFFLTNRHYFLLFTAIKMPMKRFFNIYFSLEMLDIKLKSTHTLTQLDGDIVIIKKGHIFIKKAGEIEVAIG